jgi:CBS domain containing-hemolysin-like protein
LDIIIAAEIAVFVLLMGLSAFFSSSETALFSLNQLQLEKMRRASNPKLPLVERLLSQPRQLIVTILIGNEFVNVSASVISAAIVIRVFGDDSKWINLLIMVPILLLVGEITPKTLAIRNNAAFAGFQAAYIDLFARAIGPLRWIVRRISDFFITLVVGRERSRANILTEDMVRSLAEEAVGDGALDKNEALYIARIFDFGDKALRDIMTPRSQVHFLPAGASLEDAALNYERTGHTKVPVFEGGKDNVVGVLYARDLLDEDRCERTAAGKPAVVSDLVREAYFVPETKTVGDLFYTFRKRKLSLAMVIDEYGGITGLATMEDVLECIFGEIMSPSETLRQQPASVEKTGDNDYRVDGTTTVHELNSLLGSNLDADATETVGGLLLSAFGELPAVGSRVVLHSLEFSVEAVDGRRISKVSIKPVPPLEPSPHGSASSSPEE